MKNKRRASIGRSEEPNCDLVSVSVDGSHEELGAPVFKVV